MQNIWPIKHFTDTALTDARYSITREYDGRALNGKSVKSFVFRFCDEYMSSHATYEQAVEEALSYQQTRAKGN